VALNPYKKKDRINDTATNAMVYGAEMSNQKKKIQNRSLTGEGHHGHGNAQFLCITGIRNSTRR
jgi:hypothetical protein